MSDLSKIDSASLLAKWKKAKSATKADLVEDPSKAVTIPSLSKGQERLYLLQKLDPNNTFYQYAHLYKFHGEVQKDLLVDSINYVVNRHESLRAYFTEEQGKVQQKIRPTATLDVNVRNLAAALATERDAAVYEFANQPFDLEADLLIRCKLLEVSADETWLVLSIHHIIGDRWSLDVLQRETFEIYKQKIAGTEAKLAPLTATYSDYIKWQHQLPNQKSALDYWTTILGKDTELLKLPSQLSRPKSLQYKGSVINHKLSKELSDQIKNLAHKQQATLFQTVLAALDLLLHKYSGKQYIKVGTPVSTRDQLSFQDLIGFCTETVVLQAEVKGEQTFTDLLQQVKQQSLDAFENKHVPFDQVVSALKISREPNVNPIFQVMYIHEMHIEKASTGLPFEVIDGAVDLGVSKFDATLFSREVDDCIGFSLEYSTEVVDEMSAKNILTHLQHILEVVAKDEQYSIKKISALPVAQFETITKDWNKKTDQQPPYKTVVEAVRKIAKHTPTVAAVNDGTTSINYQQLDDKSDQLAAEIISICKTDQAPIGIYLDRTTDFALAMLGVLKSGVAYIPLDLSYPSDRLQYMVQESGIRLIVSRSKIDTALFENLAIINIDKLTATAPFDLPLVSAASMAYVIFTSGSTGQPKGVGISHKNLAYSTFSRSIFYPEDPSCFLLMSPFSFDSSVAGIWWTLTTGGTLCIAPHRIEQDINKLSKIIADNAVSHTLMLPSLYEALLKYGQTSQLHSLVNVMVAGEACRSEVIHLHHKTLAGTKLYNEYGPTECTVWCVATELESQPYERVPIGRPIPYYSAYILDGDDNIVAPGVAGQLYIGGEGVTDGYINGAEATAEKFKPNKYGRGNYYQTGDLAMYDHDGTIHFLGRVDRQVKIRGHRIELGEINKILNSIVSDAEVVTVPKTTIGNKQILVSYLTSATNIKTEQLRAALTMKLPAYMVPAKIIQLTSYPRLPNGKIDVNALPFESNAENKVITAPTTETETKLVKIWKQIIGIAELGIDDNFFSLGGDSIMSIQLVSLARDQGLALAANHIFEFQTIRTLAAEVEHQDISSSTETLVLDEVYERQLSTIQRAFLFNAQRAGADEGQLFLQFKLSGPINIDRLNEAWVRTIERHQVLRTRLTKSNDGKTVTQVVTPESEGHISWVNLPAMATEERAAQLTEHLTALQGKLDLFIDPNYRLSLVTNETQKHSLNWVCHHLFLDGWSCGLIIKDLLQYYHLGAKYVPEVIYNHLTFEQWLSEQDNKSLQQHWQSDLQGFDEALLFKKTNAAGTNQNLIGYLGEEQTKAVANYSKANSISPSLLLEAVWTLLLGQLFDTADVLFGMTVSGRNIEFPGIQNATGLYMNVVPERVQIDYSATWVQWLQNLQRAQGKKRANEYARLEDIGTWVQWPVHTPMFESLFVFGNFLNEEVQIGDVVIEGFEGGFTSSLPLAVRINPVKKTEITVRYNNGSVGKETAEWLLQSYQKVVQHIVTAGTNSTVGELQYLAKAPQTMSTTKVNKKSAIEINPLSSDEKAYGEVAKIYKQIWQQTLDIQDIKSSDDFFALGGTSLMALSLVSKLEQYLGYSYPPSILFEASTYSDLFEKITQGDQSEEMPLVIPMKHGREGEIPLFCFHAGGTQVFFYKNFTEFLPDHIPVYTVQPPELKAIADYPRTIAELAAIYIAEIRKVYPVGPYHMLSTCFSNAVLVEITDQLHQQGEEVGKLIVIDSAPVLIYEPKLSVLQKIKAYLSPRLPDKISHALFPAKNPLITPFIYKDKSDYEGDRLEMTIALLTELYDWYRWKSIDQSIYLVRSKVFSEMPEKDYHITHWEHLTKGVNTATVPGNHMEIFENPNAEYLAKVVASFI